MQRVTTSELRVTGPADFSAALPQPPVTLGFYRDIAVLAFPAPADEGVRMKDFSPVASASGDEPPGDRLTDGDARTFIRLPAQTRPAAVCATGVSKTFSARTVKITGGRGIPECSGDIQVSEDGRKFRTVQPFAFTGKGSPVGVVSLGAQPVAARFWRVQFTAIGSKAAATATNIPLAEIELAPRLSIDNVDAKDGQNGNFVLSSPAADGAAAGAVQRRDVIDLTSKLTADGKLNWHAPAGEWIILRAGYTPTGVNNHPAAYGGEGLECDKFSKAALDAHWAGFTIILASSSSLMPVLTVTSTLDIALSRLMPSCASLSVIRTFIIESSFIKKVSDEISFFTFPTLKRFAHPIF